MSRRRFTAWLLAGAVGSTLAIAGAHAQSPAGGLAFGDAVRLTVAEQPAIRLQRERESASRAGVQAARGQFDVSLASSFDRVRSETPNTIFEQQVQLLPPSSVANLSTYRVSAQKQLRSGQLLAPRMEVQRSDLSDLPVTASRASVALDVVQPLFGGRTREVVTAPLRASEIELSAATLDLQHTRAASVLQTTVAYWSYVAGYRRVAILRESEARARQLAEDTRALIAADNRPAADLSQALANLADRASTRAAGEQALVEARHALGLAMGLAAADIAALAAPTDSFPVPPEMLQIPTDLVARALQQRADLASAGRRTESAATLTVAARDAVKPRVDLITSVGYTGLDEGDAIWRYLSPFQRRVQGPNVSVHLGWTQFLDNNVATGQLSRSLALERQTQILRADLAREIESAVTVAIDALVRSAERLRQSQQASGYYRTAVDDERVKQQLGRATVIDLITTEDRLTRTLLDHVAAEQAYAIALARLRYETGTLIGADETSIDLARVATIPGSGQ